MDKLQQLLNKGFKITLSKSYNLCDINVTNDDDPDLYHSYCAETLEDCINLIDLSDYN